MFFKILSITFLSVSLLIGRFATEEETTHSLEHSVLHYKINKDGTYEVISEDTLFIKNEQGRDDLSKSVDIYREGSEKIEILEAKTILDDKEYPIKKEDIEDKQLASSTNGFSTNRQVIVAFPQAQVGAKLYIKKKLTSTLVITKDHFFERIQFQDDGWVKHTEIKIDSQIPLKKMVNDPNGMLDVHIEDEKDGYFKKATFRLKKPYTTKVVFDLPGYLNPKKICWISLSSLDKWENILKDLIPYYDKVLNSELPDLYLKIIDEAKTKTTDKEKIETVIAKLNENVQYLGSWMTFEGRFIPRSFQHVEKSRFGDCKDFATGTAAMLRNLGFKAEVIFIKRGENVPDYEGLPLVFANHVTVKAIGEDGKVYWIDPTNFVSTTMILPDVADRSVLVPSDHEKGLCVLEKSPKVDPFCVQRTDCLTFIEHDRIDREVDLSFSETFGLTFALTGIELRMSKDMIADILYQSIAGSSVKKEDQLKCHIPDLKSRIISPLTFSLRYLSDDLLKSNVGRAYMHKVGISFMKFIKDIRPDENVNDLILDPMAGNGLYDYKVIISKKKIMSPEKLNFSLETPWFKVSRSIRVEGEDTIILIRLEILVDMIKNEDLKTEIFKDAQKKLISDFSQIVIELDESSSDCCSFIDKVKSYIKG